MIDKKGVMPQPVPSFAQAGGRHAVVMGALLSLFVFAVCYSRSFVLPHVPILPVGDQIGFVDNGSRIIAGELPYRDYFEVVPVGTDLTYAVLIKWFGLDTWIPGFVMACLAAATVMLMTVLAGRAMRGSAIVLPGLLLLGFVLPGSLDATHHWFSTLAAVAGMLVLLDNITPPRIATSGALCGLAACFTQTVGAALAAAFVAYLVWKTRREGVPAGERLRKCLLLCGAAAAMFALVNAYFVWTAGLRRWIFFLFIYPLRYYPAPDGNSWRVLLYDFRWHPGLGRWISFPFVYATVPLVYLIFGLVVHRRWRKDRGQPWDWLVLLEVTGFAMFLAIAPSPSVKRLSTVSPPAMILLTWLLDRPGSTAGRLRTVVGALAVALAIAAPVYTQRRWRAQIDLPAGRTAVDPVWYEEYRWALRHTSPGQPFFGNSTMYLPLRLWNPASIEGVDSTEYTRPEQVVALVQALEKHRIPLMILGSTDIAFISTDHSLGHLGPFRDYLLQNYHLTKTFQSGDQVWERTDAPPASQ